MNTLNPAEVLHNADLAPYNTFGLSVRAEHLAIAHTIEHLQSLLQDYAAAPLLVLGGGSNVLFTRDVEGLVILNRLSGIQSLGDDAERVYLRVGAGEHWHEFVLYCIAQGYAGIENLSLIPGCVGAAPMQNIGAYGVEIGEYITVVHTLRIADGEPRVFSHSECAFGYRESIFKSPELRGKYLITAVDFALHKQAKPNLAYGAIRQTLAEMGISEANATPKHISEAVCHIRRSKLPDPAVIGNAGSFFKNPEIPLEQALALQAQYPTIPLYETRPQYRKVAAGWLIEQAGWRGKRVGAVGVHEAQALVLVNHGGGTGQEILQLASAIQEDVQQKFGIALQAEVNVY